MEIEVIFGGIDIRGRRNEEDGMQLHVVRDRSGAHRTWWKTYLGWILSLVSPTLPFQSVNVTVQSPLYSLFLLFFPVRIWHMPTWHCWNKWACSYARLGSGLLLWILNSSLLLRGPTTGPFVPFGWHAQIEKWSKIVLCKKYFLDSHWWAMMTNYYLFSFFFSSWIDNFHTLFS